VTATVIATETVGVIAIVAMTVGTIAATTARASATVCYRGPLSVDACIPTSYRA
jgi:hypothetical protein